MNPLWTRNFLMAFGFYLLMPTLPMYLTNGLILAFAAMYGKDHRIGHTGLFLWASACSWEDGSPRSAGWNWPSDRRRFGGAGRRAPALPEGPRLRSRPDGNALSPAQIT